MKALVLGLGLLVSGVTSLSPAPVDSLGLSAVEASDKAKKPGKVMCSYIIYGEKRYVCGLPPMEELKARCSEKATQEIGQKTECMCTEDQKYIGAACD